MDDMGSSKNVIPAEAGIYKLLTSLDSRLRGSDKFGIIRGCHKNRIRDLRLFKAVHIHNRVLQPCTLRRVHRLAPDNLRRLF